MSAMVTGTCSDCGNFRRDLKSHWRKGRCKPGIHPRGCACVGCEFVRARERHQRRVTTARAA